METQKCLSSQNAFRLRAAEETLCGRITSFCGRRDAVIYLLIYVYIYCSPTPPIAKARLCAVADLI